VSEVAIKSGFARECCDGTSAAFHVIFPLTTLKGYDLFVYTFLHLFISYVTPIPFTRTLLFREEEKIYEPLPYQVYPFSCYFGRDIFLSLLFPSTLSMYYSPIMKLIFILFYGSTASSGPWPPKYHGCTITLRQTALVRTPLNG